MMVSGPLASASCRSERVRFGRLGLSHATESRHIIRTFEWPNRQNAKLNWLDAQRYDVCNILYKTNHATMMLTTSSRSGSKTSNRS